MKKRTSRARLLPVSLFQLRSHHLLTQTTAAAASSPTILTPTPRLTMRLLLVVPMGQAVTATTSVPPSMTNLSCEDNPPDPKREVGRNAFRPREHDSSTSPTTPSSTTSSSVAGVRASSLQKTNCWPVIPRPTESRRRRLHLEPSTPTFSERGRQRASREAQSSDQYATRSQLSSTSLGYGRLCLCSWRARYSSC